MSPSTIKGEVIVTPGIEALLIGYLNEQLPIYGTGQYANVQASASLPADPRPQYFVRITAAGGSRVSLVVSNARVVMDVYGPTNKDTLVLANVCVGLIRALVQYNGVQFYKKQLATTEPVNLPDPSITDRVRYTANPAVGVRASA